MNFILLPTSPPPSEEELQSSTGVDTQSTQTASSESETSWSENIPQEPQGRDEDEGHEYNVDTSTEELSPEAQTARNYHDGQEETSRAVHDGRRSQYYDNRRFYHDSDRVQPLPPAAASYGPMESSLPEQTVAPSYLPRNLSHPDPSLVRRFVSPPRARVPACGSRFGARPTSDHQSDLSNPWSAQPNDPYHAHPSFQNTDPSTAYTQGTPNTLMDELHTNTVEALRRQQKLKRKHQCESCGKWFLRPSSFELHMSYHSPARPYNRPRPRWSRHTDGAGFSARANMRNDFRNIHEDESPQDLHPQDESLQDWVSIA
jgi:hypothetical protein